MVQAWQRLCRRHPSKGLVMNASQIGSADWWKVIRSMPWQEALVHLNDYKAELMVVSAGTPSYVVAGAQISKINAEIRRINVLIDQSRYVKAMRMVLTSEQFDLVQATKRELEQQHWSAA